VSTLERAIVIAADAHAGQVDKAGEPYILHPLRVMLLVSGETARIVAVLHDVVEDTPVTLEQLRESGYSAEVIDAVDALTRRDGEDYFAFVERAGRNQIARAVKLADLADNMDMTRIASPSTRDTERLARYSRAKEMLER